MSRQRVSWSLPAKAAPKIRGGVRVLSIDSVSTASPPDALQSWWRAVEHVSYLLRDEAQGYWQRDAEQRYQVPVANENISVLLTPDEWARQLVKMFPARSIDEDTLVSVLSSLWSLNRAQHVYRRDDSEGHLIAIDADLKRLSGLIGKVQPQGLRRLIREWLSRHTQADPTLHVVQEFRRVWNEASAGLNEDIGSFSIRVLSIAHHFCDSLEVVSPGETNERSVYGRLSTVLVDTSAIFDKGPGRIRVFFLHGGRLLKEDLDDLRYVLSQKQERIAFLVMFAEGGLVDDACRLLDSSRQSYAYDVCVVDYRRMLAIVGAREPRRSLRKMVLPAVDLVSVSPFKIFGPTRDDMFFGRERELREISDHVDSTSYAIIGGRRIGKTSILMRLSRTLPRRGFYTLYQDCSNIPTHEAFLSKPPRYWEPNRPPDAPTTLGDLLRSLPLDRKLVLLLDETGPLVFSDWGNRWPLFKTLRALANSGHAQVVLAGERVLRDALHDSSTPLFNFPSEMIIGCLDSASTEELVVQSMKRLEITLVEEAEVVRRIYDSTSGHPNVVQRLCHRLVQRLNEQDARHITPGDVEGVVRDPRFQHDDFLDTYWGTATALEKVISLLMVSAGEACTLKGVRQALADRCNLHPKAREVKKALQWLVELRSLLRHTPTGYEFAVDAFPRVVADTATLEEMLEILAEEYAEGTIGG